MANKAILVLALFCVIPLAHAEDNSSQTICRQSTIVYRHNTFTRTIGVDPFIEISVGLLALALLAVSALAYYRDRRMRFLIVCLAFFVYSVKGFLGVLDIMIPRDSSMLDMFSDLLDFAILFLLFVAVMKD